jgi:uncharacterized OsmC-like protein
MGTQATVSHENGIDLNTLQETVNAVQNNPELGKSVFRAHNKWIGANHNRTTIDGYFAANAERSHAKEFQFEADEPPLLAGGDQAANPVEHLLDALASCMTTAMVAHAAVRGIHIDELESRLEGHIDLQGYLGTSATVPKGYTDIDVTFTVKADEENLERLKRLARFSPVYNTIINGANVNVTVERS